MCGKEILLVITRSGVHVGGWRRSLVGFMLWWGWLPGQGSGCDGYRTDQEPEDLVLYLIESLERWKYKLCVQMCMFVFSVSCAFQCWNFFAEFHLRYLFFHFSRRHHQTSGPKCLISKALRSGTEQSLGSGTEMSFSAVVLINTLLQQGVLLSFMTTKENKILFPEETFFFHSCYNRVCPPGGRNEALQTPEELCGCTSAFNKYFCVRHSFQSKTFHWDVSLRILHPPVFYFPSRITGFLWFLSSQQVFLLCNSCPKMGQKVQINCETWTETEMWRCSVRFCFRFLFKCFITGPICCVGSSGRRWESH